jgi:4-hydroxybenzoate polyprenyltransferase
MIVENIIGGFICIVIGLIILIWTYKYPSKDNGVLANNYGGYISGIGFIIGGIMILCEKS